MIRAAIAFGLSLTPTIGLAQQFICTGAHDRCVGVAGCNTDQQSLTIAIKGDAATLTWNNKLVLAGVVQKEPEVIVITEPDGAPDEFLFLSGDGERAVFTGAADGDGNLIQGNIALRCDGALKELLN